MITKLKQLSADQDGSTAIEYSLLAGVAAVMMFTGIAKLGGSNGGILGDVLTKVSTALGIG